MTHRRILLAVLLSLALLLASCSAGGGAATTPTPVPTPVAMQKPTYQVQRGEVLRTLRLTGRVAPVQQQELFFRIAGYVQDVLVERGAQVQAGDLLANLEEPEQYQAEINAANLALLQAQGELDALQRGAAVRAAEARLALVEAEAELAQARQDRQALEGGSRADPLKLEEVQASLLQAQAAAVKAQADFDKVAHKSVTDPQRIQRLQVLLAARQRLAQVQALYNGYQGVPQPDKIALAGAILALAEARRDQAQADVERLQDGIDPAELSLAQAKVAEAQARLDLARKALERVELRAPFAGTVLSLGVAPGSQVEAFQPVLTLADPAALEIVVRPSPEDLTVLGIGQAATVERLSRAGGTDGAHITGMPYTAGAASGAATAAGRDPDPVVHISLDNPAVPLTLGEAATVVIAVEQRENVLWLPPAALRTFQGRDFVFVQESGVQRRIDVRLGLRSTDRVEILEGLSEGQTVVGP